MREFTGKVAVITGAGSGFGREFALEAARRQMRLVLADVEADALVAVAEALRGVGADVLAYPCDVSVESEVRALAGEAYARFAEVHLLFNNAGVATGGLSWEASTRDWQWVIGVNLMGVVHGLQSFVPRMLEAATPAHIVNTASVAGLIAPQGMAVYNVSKHAVVALSETLYHDLRTQAAPIGVTVLCPAFVPTAIHRAERNRPTHLARERAATASEQAAQAASEKAVSSGRISAAEVALITFGAIEDERFYCLTHPRIMPSVRARCEDVALCRNPTDPFAHRPELAARLATQP
jgi:NAD(P)-dependent dehydrogenase (short-subunit alcohol dehydrogenase family)